MAYKETLRNPFMDPPSTARKIGIFSTRSEAGTPAQIAVERRFRAEQRIRTGSEDERILTIADLHQELLDLEHPEACESVFKCDPWKYEPILLHELMRERSKKDAMDAARIERLRKLIRAGSWLSYPRTKAEDAFRPFANIVKDEIKRRESEVARQISDAERSSDPEEARELRDALEEETSLYEAGRKTFQDGALGEEAEQAAQAIEYLYTAAYTALKQLSIRHPGLTLDDARRHPVGRAFAEEIERLRPARDWAYFRRAYPKHASKTNGR